jgi:D-alanyl-D-alanine dipeptidase
MYYATKENFTGQILYASAKCYLREAVAEKISAIQNELEKQGLGLLVWDGYRPLSVQK